MKKAKYLPYRDSHGKQGDSTGCAHHHEMPPVRARVAGREETALILLESLMLDLKVS